MPHPTNDAADAIPEKARLRAAALARRDALSDAFRDDAARKMAETARSLFASFGDKVVTGYWPIRSEADPRPLLEVAAEAGASIGLPVLEGTLHLRFRRWDGDPVLIPVGFGTMGPRPEQPEVEPDVIMLPLAAFDANGHRLGYGRGHYDRTIARLVAAGAKPLLIGIAFSAQEVERIPNEPHDIALDMIVTEDGVRDLRQGGS